MRIDLKNLIAPSKRIDRAIELLIHYNLTLIEVAYQLNYGSVEEFVNSLQGVGWLFTRGFQTINSLGL